MCAHETCGVPCASSFLFQISLKAAIRVRSPAPTSSFTFRHEFILVQVRLRDAQGRVASEHRLIAPLLLEEVLGALGEGRHAAASLRRRQVRQEVQVAALEGSPSATISYHLCMQLLATGLPL